MAALYYHVSLLTPLVLVNDAPVDNTVHNGEDIRSAFSASDSTEIVYPPSQAVWRLRGQLLGAIAPPGFSFAEVTRYSAHKRNHMESTLRSPENGPQL